ncbi:MAG: hypothetical protein ABL903_20875 [Methylococcales bacterium]
MTEDEVILWGILGGAIGALASYMLVAYNNFERIPTIQDAKIAKKSLRVTFLALRVLFGVLVGLIFSFWFMDDVVSGNLSKNKFVFISALIGFSTTLLSVVSEALQKTLAKIVTKIQG